MSRRVSFGRFTFVPTGKPVQLGASQKRGLADVEEYGEARSITLIVGQNKGLEPHNKTGACARKPKRFSTAEVDRAFVDLREAQVDKKYIGASRVSGHGWFKGKPETSVSYDIAYVPDEDNQAEPTYEAFRANMDRVSEKLAEKFCQDSVLIIRDEGGRRTVASATWKPTRRPRRPAR